MGETRSSAKRSYDARVGERARRSWRATTTVDRVVVVVAVLLLAGVDLVPRVVFWVDPELDNRSRYHLELEPEDRGLADPWCSSVPLERTLLRLPDGTREVYEVAHESGPWHPFDRWGRPWVMVSTHLADKTTIRERVYSSGPNGRFEWGEGDDIEVLDGTYYSRTWWPLAVLAGVVAIPYFSIRVARLPRSPSVIGELIRASGASVAPIVLAYFVIALGFPELDVAPSFVLVPGRVAVFFTASFIIWLAILLFRLRRP
jgi:hypothetical protein